MKTKGHHAPSIRMLNLRGLCAEYCGNKHTFIVIRKHVGGHYEDVFICDACWNQEHPERVPVRVKHG